MKKIILILIGIVVTVSQSCSSQVYMEKETLQKVISDGSFTFMAQKANVTNNDVVNIANSLPNYGANRMLELDYGYNLEIKGKELTSTLPYFGRGYNTNSYDTQKQGLRFASKDFSISKTLNRKGNHIITIKPNDVSHVDQLILEVYKNGKAFLSVDANDRQPISFDGYLMKNEEVKK